MCAHFQSQPFFNALFAKAPGAAFEEPPADTAVHVEDPLGVNVDFAPHTAMDEVFINYPSKPAASLEGDDAAIGLDGYGARQPAQARRRHRLHGGGAGAAAGAARAAARGVVPVPGGLSALQVPAGRCGRRGCP